MLRDAAKQAISADPLLPASERFAQLSMGGYSAAPVILVRKSSL